MSTSLGPDTATSGLIYSFDAGNKKSYAGSGTGVANLSSATANFGTLTNGVASGTTKVGEFVFDGVDDYINVATAPVVFQSGVSFTISYWLNVATTSVNYGIVLCGSGPFNNGGLGLEIRYQTTDMECTVADGVGAGIRTTYASALSTGQWNYFNFVFDRDTLWGAIYKNGVRVATQSYASETTNSTAYAMTVGKGHDGYVNGRISSFSVHNRALSAEEIYTAYVATRSRYA